MYKIKDLVFWLGKKAIIVGTKEQPRIPGPNGDPFNRKIIPFKDKSMDYQIMFENPDGSFQGPVDPFECRENDLEPRNPGV